MGNQPTIVFIGAGHMGSSLIGGLVSDGYPPEAIWASNPSTSKLDMLKKRFNVNTTTDNDEACANADVLVFAVTPQIGPDVVQAIRPAYVERKPLVISVMTGITANAIDGWLGGGCSIVRCMPNMPVLVKTGATALFANQTTTTEQRDQAESILRAVGMTIWLENEALMDSVTALSGSGPAYFYYVMEAMQQAGEKLGLDSNAAKLLVVQTALGAARVALESQESLAHLREGVTVEGGTTARALSVLQQHDVAEHFIAAVEGACDRAKELAEQAGGA